MATENTYILSDSQSAKSQQVCPMLHYVTLLSYITLGYFSIQLFLQYCFDISYNTVLLLSLVRFAALVLLI